MTGVTVATAPDEYSYDPWGEMTAVTESVQQPLRYMARELDPITGLYYVRNRWYDPVSIGLEGGINTYAYAGTGLLRLGSSERNSLGESPIRR